MLRAELDGYTFRQLPRFVDEVNGKIDAVQLGAILRHLGRKYGEGAAYLLHAAYMHEGMYWAVGFRSALDGLCVILC